MKEILFNEPVIIGNEGQLFSAFYENNKKFSGDGLYTQKIHDWFKNYVPESTSLLTTSCTHAMEIAALLMNIAEGDEVILPSYTFVSTANAFALRGAKLVFVDINPITMNIDLNLVEKAINSKTKAIAIVHYGGIACNMDQAVEITQKHNLFLLEDAAQCIDAFYKGKPLGSFGDFGAFSFHDTKNIHCGEGGLLMINNTAYKAKAEIIREKGTNRSKFLRGQIDKYTWVNIGSSYLPSEFNALVLLNQLENLKKITKRRLEIWNLYNTNLVELEKKGYIETCSFMLNYEFNAHIYFIKLKNIEQRQELINFLGEKNIQSVFHYVPLHSSKAGNEFGVFFENDNHTTKESERLLRLPMHINLTDDDVLKICNNIKIFIQ